VILSYYSGSRSSLSLFCWQGELERKIEAQESFCEINLSLWLVPVLGTVTTTGPESRGFFQWQQEGRAGSLEEESSPAPKSPSADRRLPARQVMRDDPGRMSVTSSHRNNLAGEAFDFDQTRPGDTLTQSAYNHSRSLDHRGIAHRNCRGAKGPAEFCTPAEIVAGLHCFKINKLFGPSLRL
jgi:hypothetical protein